MKKTFILTNPKVKLARQIEIVKRDIKRYVKRERNKALPDDADFWDFDCKFGETAEEAKEVHLAEISKFIDDAESKQLESFYLEIMAKPAVRTKKPKPDVVESDENTI